MKTIFITKVSYNVYMYVNLLSLRAFMQHTCMCTIDNKVQLSHTKRATYRAILGPEYSTAEDKLHTVHFRAPLYTRIGNKHLCVQYDIPRPGRMVLYDCFSMLMMKYLVHTNFVLSRCGWRYANKGMMA